MQRIDLCRELRVAAIHRKRVLREIVRADGEEIGFRRDLVCCERSRGGFDHYTDLDRSSPSDLTTRFIDQGAYGTNLGRARDHGQQQLALLVRLNAQNRS
jgi:hypothetical protein